MVFAVQGAHRTAISLRVDEHKQMKDYLKKIEVDPADSLNRIVRRGAKLCRVRFLDVCFIDGYINFLTRQSIITILATL